MKNKTKGQIDYDRYLVNYSYELDSIGRKNTMISLDKIIAVDEFKISEVINPLFIERSVLDKIAKLCEMDIHNKNKI